MNAVEGTTQDNATVPSNDETEIEMKAEPGIGHIPELQPDPENLAEIAAAEKEESKPEHKPEFDVESESESESEPELKVESGPEPKVEPQPEPLAPPPLSSPKSDIDFTYEAGKVSIKFLFANRDGLSVSIQCDMSDTVATVKGSLLSLWPEELERCSEGDRIRLICMGKGILQPDSITLEQCDLPVFKTHPTPINVSIKPKVVSEYGQVTKHSSSPGHTSNVSQLAQADCCCTIQ